MRPLLLVLAALAGAACRPRPGARADAADARPSRPPPAVVQLPPALDQWRAAATYYPGADPDTGVVLVHQLGSDRSEWGPLVAKLQAGRAVSVLAVDLRGHGDSTRGPRDETVTWERFGTDRERWASTAYDVVAAVQYLRTEGARRVVVVGSSLGGSAALLAATGALGEYTAPPRSEIDGVAILSPGLAYRGVDIREPMQRYLQSRRPLLLFAGDQDRPSAEAVPVLVPGNLLGVEAEVFGGAREHGVSLCNAVPSRWDRVDAWVRRTLGLLPDPSVRDS